LNVKKAMIIIMISISDSENHILTALAQARDAILLARGFIAELKVELAALYALSTLTGDLATATKQVESRVILEFF